MAYERIICCCGASTWTKVIGWLEIVFQTINFIWQGVNTIIIHYENESDKNGLRYQHNVKLQWKLARYIVISILGIIMAIILLIGTNQKRVGYIKAWLIYGGAMIIYEGAMIVYSSLFVVLVVGMPPDLYMTLTNILVLALSVFIFVVVYTHMKDIQKGVFDLHPKLPEAV